MLVDNTIRHGGLNVELFGEEKTPENRRDFTSMVAFLLDSTTPGFVGMTDTNSFCPFKPKPSDTAAEITAKLNRKAFQKNLFGAAGLSIE